MLTQYEAAPRNLSFRSAQCKTSITLGTQVKTQKSFFFFLPLPEWEVSDQLRQGEMSQVAFHIQCVRISQNETVRIDPDYT